jgi:UDP-sugar transporter A1/2/3
MRHRTEGDIHLQKQGLDRTAEDEGIQTTDTGKQGPPASLKYMSLVLLTLQNAVLILAMRYARVRVTSDMLFFSTTAVVMAEMCKFLVCLVIIFIQEGGTTNLLRHLHENIIQQPMDCVKITVPSIIYTLQNNLLYVAISNLEAATYQVTYQLKILTTAIFSVIMLRKQLSKVQWVSLVILMVGVSAVQLQPHDNKVSQKINTEQNPMIGLLAVVVSCLMSGFAGVYFERILKGTPQTLWLRNVQLGFIGMIFGYIAMEFNDGTKVHEKGFFFGYDWVVWFIVFLQAFGGLMVAVVVKYADNILKGFATSAAIILSCIASVYFFDFQLSIQFVTGAGLVILSVYLYSVFIPATGILPVKSVQKA